MSETTSQVLIQNGRCDENPSDLYRCKLGIYDMAMDSSGDFYFLDMNKSLKKWNSKTKLIGWSLNLKDAISAFSLDRDLLVAGGTNWIYLINPSSGAIIRNISIPFSYRVSKIVIRDPFLYIGYFHSNKISKFHKNGFNLLDYKFANGMVSGAVALSVYGQQVYVGEGNGNVVIFDESTGAESKRFKAHSDAIFSILITDDGYMYTGSRERSVKKWKTLNNELISEFKGYSTVSLAIDQNALYSASEDGTIIQWNMYSEEPLQVLSVHTRQASKIILNNGVLYSGSYDGTVRKWQLEHPNFIRSYKVPTTENIPFDYLVRNDSILYIASQAKGIFAWNLQTETFSTIASTVNGGVSCLEYYEDWLIAGSTNGHIYGWNKGQLLDLNGHSLTVTGLTVGKDLSELISVSLDGKVIKWNALDGTKLSTFSGFGAIYSLFLNGNELYLGLNGKVIAIHSDTGLLLSTFEQFDGPVKAIYLKDLTLFIGDSKGYLSMWDTHNLASIRVSTLSYSGAITDISFATNNRLFTASADSSIIEWNTTTLEPIKKWFGHTKGVTGIDVTVPYIHSVSQDGSLIKWTF